MFFFFWWNRTHILHVWSWITPSPVSLCPQCLLYVQLPFMEDLRQFTFPMLEHNKKFTASGESSANKDFTFELSLKESNSNLFNWSDKQGQKVGLHLFFCSFCVTGTQTTFTTCFLLNQFFSYEVHVHTSSVVNYRQKREQHFILNSLIAGCMFI